MGVKAEIANRTTASEPQQQRGVPGTEIVVARQDTRLLRNSPGLRRTVEFITLISLMRSYDSF
jgi:hypothetical protein